MSDGESDTGHEDGVVVWEFRCRCGEELEVPATETDFSPTSLGLPECEACGEWMQHVGPVLDECDECNTDLLYHGNQVRAFGLESVCDGCYDMIAEAI